MEFWFREIRENGHFEHIMFVDDWAFIYGSDGMSIVKSSRVPKWKKEYASDMSAIAAYCFIQLFIADKDLYCGEENFQLVYDVVDLLGGMTEDVPKEVIQIATWVYRRTLFVGAKAEENRINFWYDQDVSEEYLCKVAKRLDQEARANKSKIRFGVEYGETPNGHVEGFYAYW